MSEKVFVVDGKQVREHDDLLVTQRGTVINQDKYEIKIIPFWKFFLSNVNKI